MPDLDPKLEHRRRLARERKAAQRLRDKERLSLDAQNTTAAPEAANVPTTPSTAPIAAQSPEPTSSQPQAQSTHRVHDDSSKCPSPSKHIDQTTAHKEPTSKFIQQQDHAASSVSSARRETSQSNLGLMSHPLPLPAVNKNKKDEGGELALDSVLNTQMKSKETKDIQERRVSGTLQAQSVKEYPLQENNREEEGHDNDDNDDDDHTDEDEDDKSTSKDILLNSVDNTKLKLEKDDSMPEQQHNIQLLPPQNSAKGKDDDVIFVDCRQRDTIAGREMGSLDQIDSSKSGQTYRQKKNEGTSCSQEADTHHNNRTSLLQIAQKGDKRTQPAEQTEESNDRKRMKKHHHQEDDGLKREKADTAPSKRRPYAPVDLSKRDPRGELDAIRNGTFFKRFNGKLATDSKTASRKLLSSTETSAGSRAVRQQDGVIQANSVKSSRGNFFKQFHQPVTASSTRPQKASIISEIRDRSRAKVQQTRVADPVPASVLSRTAPRTLSQKLAARGERESSSSPSPTSSMAAAPTSSQAASSPVSVENASSQSFPVSKDSPSTVAAPATSPAPASITVSRNLHVQRQEREEQSKLNMAEYGVESGASHGHGPPSTAPAAITTISHQHTVKEQRLSAATSISMSQPEPAKYVPASNPSAKLIQRIGMVAKADEERRRQADLHFWSTQR